MRGKKLCCLVLVLALLVYQSGMTGFAYQAVTNDAAAGKQVRAQPAMTLYVDGQIGIASCTNYDVVSRSCGGGTSTAYATLNGAAAVTQPGIVVFVRQGTYNEQFAPQNSGTAGGQITYSNYLDEEVFVASSSYPATIILNSVSYITIEGLTVADHRWLEATDAHHNIIRNNQFLRTSSSGTTGNVRFVGSDHNRMVGNVLEDGNDNLLLIDSDYNLVEGNTITEGRHSVFSIRCANYNVIRDNFFSNSQQKIGEIYDCGDDTTIVPHAFDATKHNVIEDNVFAEAVSYYSTSGGNGIQYAGQDGIIRRNVFYHTNAGLAMQVYGDEALYNHYNRVYNNVFYDNECAGLSIREANLDNVYKNNILFKNKGQSGGDCFNTSPAQLLYRGTLQAFHFERNNILNEGPGEAVIQSEFGSGDTLAYFESNYPTLFVDNLEIDPGFRDETSYDFALTSASPMVDAGIFLARAASSGSGTILAVDDARYFHDGYGIVGMEGDLVQLEGQTERARVVDIDYDSHTLTLDRALSWNAGQGVSLAYHGVAPDVGAHEFVPSLILQATPANQAIHLTWMVNAALPTTSTWRLGYESETGTVLVPPISLAGTARSYVITGVVNHVWYTVTLRAVLANTPFMTDTVRVMPTDRLVFLPLVWKGRWTPAQGQFIGSAVFGFGDD